MRSSQRTCWWRVTYLLVGFFECWLNNVKFELRFLPTTYTISDIIFEILIWNIFCRNSNFDDNIVIDKHLIAEQNF